MRQRYYAAISLVLLLAIASAALVFYESNSCVQSRVHTSDAQGVMPLVSGGASTDLWNVRSMAGSVQMCSQWIGGVSTFVDMTHIAVANTAYSVVAYPHIGYGYGEFDTTFGRMNGGLAFPMTLKTLDSSGILSSISYSVSAQQGQPLDFAYDLWIEGSPQPGQRALLSDFEVMVWLYNLTLRPAGFLNGTLATRAVINGAQTNATWLVFVTRPSSSFRMLVTYLLEPTMKQGSISLQLRDFVDHATARYWHPTTLQSYYLMGVELGTEFASGQDGSARLLWNVANMEIRDGESAVTIVG